MTDFVVSEHAHFLTDISVGGIPAAAGSIRMANAGDITVRNQNDNGDFNVISFDASANMIFGDAGMPNVTINGGVVNIAALSLTTPLTVPDGGTGAGTFTDGGILLGSGTGILTALGQATNGLIPIGSTGADPVLAAIAGTANEVTVVNGAGTITLSLDPTLVIIPAALRVTDSFLAEGSSNFDLASQFHTSIAIDNTAEGEIGKLTLRTARELHTLSLATSSVTTTLAIPADALIMAVSMNVNATVVDDGGNDTWRADFSGGSTAAIAAAGTSPAQNTKVDTMFGSEIPNATTEITFLPQGGSFTEGQIEILVYYYSITSMDDEGG